MPAALNAGQLRAKADKLLDELIAMQKRHAREIAVADRAWRSAEELAIAERRNRARARAVIAAIGGVAVTGRREAECAYNDSRPSGSTFWHELGSEKQLRLIDFARALCPPATRDSDTHPKAGDASVSGSAE